MIKDIKGDILQVGHPVYFTRYGRDSIEMGTIKKIDTKNIFIDFKSYNRDKVCRMEHKRVQYRVVRR